MKKDDISRLLQRYLSAREMGKEPYFDADEVDELLGSFEESDNYDYFDEVLALGLKLHPGNTDLQIRQCKLFVYIAGAINAHLGDIIKYNKKSFGIDTLSKYNRVKHDFDYGRPYSSASEQDIEDLKIMMTFYPQDTARSFFNADYMMTYPYNMKGKACQGVYSRTRVVVIERNGLDVFFYFTMTDVGIKDFDKYLMDLKGVLGFNAMTRQDGH